MVKYVYICSSGHSGSTLLDLLLGSHSQVESLGEISQISKNIALDTQCTCGVAVCSCPLWRNVLKILSERMDVDIIANPYLLNMGYPKASVVVDEGHQDVEYLVRRKIVLGLYYAKLRYGINYPPLLKSIDTVIRNNILLYEAVKKVQGVGITVDSSKSYLKGIGLYLNDPENVRIIFLTRDGRGVMYSNLRRNKPRRASIYRWRNYYARAQLLLNKHVKQQHLLHVKYEDICINPSLSLRKICEFLGIDYEEQMLDYTAHEHHITNGNNMRFNSSSIIRLDDKWKENLSANDIRYFERIGGTLNKELGYT